MDKEMQEKLANLVKEISENSGSNSGRPIRLKKKKGEPHPKTVGLEGLAGSLDDLRVGIKYILFDLEATRRENAYLKKQIKDLS